MVFCEEGAKTRRAKQQVSHLRMRKKSCSWLADCFLEGGFAGLCCFLTTPGFNLPAVGADRRKRRSEDVTRRRARVAVNTLSLWGKKKKHTASSDLSRPPRHHKSVCRVRAEAWYVQQRMHTRLHEDSHESWLLLFKPHC